MRKPLKEKLEQHERNQPNLTKPKDGITRSQNLTLLYVCYRPNILPRPSVKPDVPAHALIGLRLLGPALS